MCLVVVGVPRCVLLVKQKTTDMVRISDSSSDVSSADRAPLTGTEGGGTARGPPPALSERRLGRPGLAGDDAVVLDATVLGEVEHRLLAHPGEVEVAGVGDQLIAERRGQRHQFARRLHDAGTARSEEHTSELQSLMRISYAVFCLKKKNQIHT